MSKEKWFLEMESTSNEDVVKIIKMKTKENLIIYAIFVAGAALMYDTQEVCDSAAANIAGAKVVQVDSFADMI